MRIKRNRRYVDVILVFIEEFNRADGTVLFDFYDSNELILFNQFANRTNSQEQPSMVFITNYFLKKIQENTYYLINSETLQIWFERGYFSSDEIDSFLIGTVVNLPSGQQEIFNSPYSLSRDSFLEANIFRHGRATINELPVNIGADLSVNVRNVGQGNWNEILVKQDVRVVYDIGIYMQAKKSDVRALIDSKIAQYSISKPILFVSHWDKDHYHALLGMTDDELKSFSYFVCKEQVPTIACRLIYGRLERTIGPDRILTLSSNRIRGRRGLPPLSLVSNPNAQLLIFNGDYHKDRNRSGIVLLVRTSNSSVVFAGDIFYKQISSYVLVHLNYEHAHYLIVPHHGGKAGNYIYNLPKLALPREAIISVGKNSYGHPLKLLKSQIKSDGFKIKETRALKADYQFPI